MEYAKHISRCIELIKMSQNQPSGTAEIVVKDKALSIRYHHPYDTVFPIVARLTQDQLRHGLTNNEWTALTKTIIAFMEKGIL